MQMKISFLGLGFAAALLAACGNSSPPPPKAKPMTAPVAAARTAEPEAAPANTANTNPPQEPPFEGYVGVAPPGKVAFGPAPPDQDAAFQAERQRMMAPNATQKPREKPPASKNANQH